MRQHPEEVFRGRVAIRPEHAPQAVGGWGSRLLELPEVDCSVDVLEQDRTARLLIAGEHDLDCLTKATPYGTSVPVARGRGPFHENPWLVPQGGSPKPSSSYSKDWYYRFSPDLKLCSASFS